jgi:hypothetical protein
MPASSSLVELGLPRFQGLVSFATAKKARQFLQQQQEGNPESAGPHVKNVYKGNAFRLSIF